MADTKARNKKILELINSGATYQSVADIYGISKQRIQQIVKAQGGASCSVSIRDQEYLKRWPGYLADGWTQKDIAEFEKISVDTVIRARRRLGISLPPMLKDTHGTLQCYRQGKCRCTDCRAANAAYYREHRKKPARSHGAAGYQHGCRCDICRAWMSQQNKKNRLRRKNREN